MDTSPLLPQSKLNVNHKINQSLFKSCLITISSLLFIIALIFHNHITLSNQQNKTELSIQPPNIIYIMLDDLGWGDISLHGAEYNTPTLDNLISQESIFLNSHYTGLVCSPSRSQILTGRYAFNMGIADVSPFDYRTIATVPHGVPLISNLLKKYKNYNTYILGKWHLGYSTEESLPLSRGFDYFYGFHGTGIFYINKTRILPEYTIDYMDWWEDRIPSFDSQEEHSTIQISDHLNDIIINYDKEYDDIDNNEPFYIYTAIQAPHIPLESSPTKSIQEKCSFIENNIYNNNGRRIYCENILEIDLLMNKLVYLLKSSKNNLWDNTLIIFTSDNGGNTEDGGCNFPYRGSKASYFEGGMKTLTFLSGGYIPTAQYGTIRNSIFHGVDWVPTLLTFAGINIENDLNEFEYNGFDGNDMSDMILYGDNNNDNIRYEAPLIVGSSDGTDDNAIVFEENNIRYKYIKKSDGSHIGPLGAWCIIEDKYNDNNEIIKFQTANMFYDYDEEYDDTTDFLFNLNDDYSETINLIDYEYLININNTNNLQYINILNMVNIAQSKLDKYRENVYYNEKLQCFSQHFAGLADPKLFNDAHDAFLTNHQFNEKFEQYCNDETNDNLKELFLTIYE